MRGGKQKLAAEIEDFVPIMKPSKGFEELKKLVIDQGICSGCSTCAAFCERIQMGKDGQPEQVKDCNMEIGAIKCSEDGTCYDCCPMVSFSIPELEKKVFGSEREDRALGYYKKIAAVRSKKKEILERAQDGGAVTSFLLCALENGLIDGAVVANRASDWSTEAWVAKTKEELINGAGTKYARTPSTMKFGKSMRDVRKLAMVGTGCQTLGARRSTTSLLKSVLEKTAESETPLSLTLIGVFCFENFPYECLKKVIESEYGVKIDQIVKTNITKGKFIVTKTDGKTIEKPVKTFGECVPESCHLCTNFTAEFADISVGSVGTDDGWSTVVVRSDKGLELLEKAKKKGYIEVSDKVDLEAIKHNIGLKKKMRKATSEKRSKEGLYVPDYT
jgi:coenzyme F420 hydrogenase subunit beta